MKSCKKLICILLVAITMLSLFAGCKKKETPVPTTEATVEPTTEPIVYSITYHPNGGVIGYDVDTDYSLEDPAELPEPERENYDFVGWYEEQDFSGYLYTDTVGETGDKVYYAKWSPKEFSISYNLDGGKMEEGTINPSAYTIETDGLSLASPVKDGYIFVGWIEEVDHGIILDDTSLEEMEPSERIVIAKGTTGDKTYTAVWAEGQKPASNPATTGRVTTSGGASGGSPSGHNHTYKKVKEVKASCYSEEYFLMECSCGHKYKDVKKPKLEHEWEPWILVKKETEEEDGIRKRSCKICRVVESEFIDEIVSPWDAGE